MKNPYIWKRRFANSNNNFDLELENPAELDRQGLLGLLNTILGEKHRGLTLSSRAAKEFQRWFVEPATPLKASAYILLGNWFLTQGGDRHSLVASRCESLWDALFPCRPLDRLSSPEPGRNHIMIPGEFDSFWNRILEAQGDNAHAVSSEKPLKAEAPNGGFLKSGTDSTPEKIRAMLDKQGLRCEIEGSPSALAEFLQIVSRWEPS